VRTSLPPVFGPLLKLYAFLIPYEFAFSDVLAKPYRVVGLLVIGLWLAAYIAFPARHLRLDRFDRRFLAILGLTAFLALFWIAFTASGSMSYLTNELALTAYAFSIYLVMKQVASTPGQAEQVLWAFVAGTVSSVLVGLMLHGLVPGTRFEGLFSNPNDLGRAVGVAVLMILHRLIFARGQRFWRLYLPSVTTLLLLLATLLLTGSREAMVGLGVAGLTLVLWARRYRGPSRASGLNVSRTIAVLLAGGLLAVGAAQVFLRLGTASGIQRLQDPVAVAAGARLDLSASGWQVATGHYFLGVGMAQYRYYHPEAIQQIGELRNAKVAQNVLGVHDDYLNLLVSGGVLALVIYVSIILGLWRALLRPLRILKGRVDPSLGLALSLLVFLVVNGAASNQLLGPVYWLVMAFITTTATWSHSTLGQREGAPASVGGT
jgi:O-antigen ligase